MGAERESQKGQSSGLVGREVRLAGSLEYRERERVLHVFLKERER